MAIKEIINKYIQQGHNYRNAQNLAAEEIVLNKIASSPLSEHVTLKGGIVMFNLTKNDRRVTQDIDFDLIRYSIDETAIKEFVKKMNYSNDDISASIDGPIEKLHQEDYQGVKVHLLLEDKAATKLKIKLDIGVHTYTAIEQKTLVFSFDSSNNSVSIRVNPCEQIFAEKLLSLARLGVLSTRYKDIYDLYYLIDKALVDFKKVRYVLELFLTSSQRKPNNLFELVDAVTDTLNSKVFYSEALKPASMWIDVDYEKLKNTILTFVAKL